MEDTKDAPWGTVETEFLPIHSAARMRDVATVTKELKSGVGVDVVCERAKNGDGGNTALWYAAQGPWPGGLAVLTAAGFTTAALALADDAVDLGELARAVPDRLALLLGAEGDGLSRAAASAADLVVRIPMAGGVDSLNVAAAAAVALWATRPDQAAGQMRR